MLLFPDSGLRGRRIHQCPSYGAADLLLPNLPEATDPAREPEGDGAPVLPMLFVRGNVSDASAIGGTGVAARASSLVARAPASPP